MDGISKMTGSYGVTRMARFRWRRIECVLEQGHIEEWLTGSLWTGSHKGPFNCCTLRNPEIEGSPAQWTSSMKRISHCFSWAHPLPYKGGEDYRSEITAGSSTTHPEHFISYRDVNTENGFSTYGDGSSLKIWNWNTRNMTHMGTRGFLKKGKLEEQMEISHPLVNGHYWYW